MSIAVPGFERKEAENPFDYTEDQIAERKLALKYMRDVWPDVNPLHAEWVYDLCKNTPADKMNEVMDKVVTVPSKYIPCNDPRSHLYQSDIPCESGGSWKTSKKNKQIRRKQ